jgi:hypothetical protein
MHRTMMPPAQWDRELIADLAAERTWLGKSEVVGVRGLATTDEAGLLGDEPKVPPVTITARFSNRQNALVDPIGSIVPTTGSSSYLRCDDLVSDTDIGGDGLSLHFDV